MAHKSRKKHIKHRREHEHQAGPVAARAPSSRAKAAAKASSARNKRGGLVRRIAKAAGKQLAAKRKRIVSRAKARVRSMLGDTGE